MDEAKSESVRAWLVKAQHDLAAARKLSASPDPYLDTAIYHCQQAAEKSIKALLVFHDQRFDKTHDWGWILTLIAFVDDTITLVQWLQEGTSFSTYLFLAGC